MIPFLTYPLALIALASLPALAAIYILRNRFRRRTVSSLVLWHFQVQSKAGGAKVHRLQLPLLFFLELLALALLVMAAAGPHWKLPQSARPLMIILDDSFSMRAVSDGVSAQGRAQAFLEKMYHQSPPPVTRLILAGTETHALGSPVKSWAQVADLLRQWRCPAPGAELDAAITLAAELGKQQANILVLTDHRPVDEHIANPRLEWRAFGARLDNFAIVNASRTALGDQDRCLIEVANFSDHTRSVGVQVRAGTNALSGSNLTLAAQESQRLVFNLPANGQPLRVALPGDALTEDDQVELLPPERRRVRVQVALADADLAALADRTLAATGLRAALSDNPELVIHETDTAAGSNAWSLRWVSAGATNAFTGPFVVDTSHPLAAGVALPGVIWAGASLTNAPGDVPAILAGNTPLLAAREDALGRRHLTLNFNPALSTLQNTPDWPILFWNMLSWRSAELPGLRESNVRLGAEVVVKTTGEPVTVTGPDGTIRSFPKAADELALETPLTGVYQVTMGALTNHFSVNALTAEKSDLTGCVSGHWGAWSEGADERMVETPATWVFGLLGLGLLVVHLFLLYAGKGGGR
jgi:hypothetical protein